jgi:hypothetical protein
LKILDMIVSVGSLRFNLILYQKKIQPGDPQSHQRRLGIGVRGKINIFWKRTSITQKTHKKGSSL